MRISAALLAIPLAVLLLTWLSLRSLNSDAELFDRAFAEMTRFAMLEAALHRDVLSARTGVLRNYDPLVVELDGLEQSLDGLRQTAAVDARAAALIERLGASVMREEDLVEQFKSNNALLQNSLAYFRLFTNRLEGDAPASDVNADVGALAAAILRLTLDTSPAAVEDVRERLDALAVLPLTRDESDDVGPLLAHGRLLAEILPATDGVLKALAIEPLPHDEQALRSIVLTSQEDSRMTARRFRLVLYLASLLLMALLAQVGWRLRARARALQRRAALEHVIAQISVSLLGTRPGGLEADIGRALGELATCVGADRAYALAPHSPVPAITWRGGTVEFPPHWPDIAPLLADRLQPTPGGLVYIPCVRRLEPGPVREMFTAVGLHAWVYLSDMGEGGRAAALGLDVVHGRGALSWSEELSLIRMALDTIRNALERERLEHERAQLEARVQQAHRMETVGALASGVAHNFNNILGAIMGYAELAEAAVAPDAPLANNIGEIRRAGERARTLVDQLLTFGRRRDLRRQPVDMHALVTESLSLLHATLPERVELAVQPLPEHVIVSGEPAQLQQIVLNLCNNAAQAMGGAGRVEIEMSVHRLAAPQPLSHGRLAAGRYMCLSVSDTGRGMTTATMERLFEPFFTTRDGGNGLGLATVREIVGEHGGAMHVRSAPDQGSRFDVWLPCTLVETAVAQARPPALTSGTGRSALVLDADAEHRLHAEEVLAALGCEPVGFARAEEALRICREDPARFDVVLVCHCEPGDSPVEIATRFRAALPGLPILLAAPSSAEFATEALLAAGISDVLHLPLKAGEVALALEQNLAVETQPSGTRAP